MKRVLVLGAGLVSKPLVEYLLESFHVIVASRTVSKAEALIGDHPEGEAKAFDITKDEDKLDQLVDGADLVISLLPYIYHVNVAN
ncbi:MAG: saccharopine dehydrogenase NADP-binding domain-containing protein, partial [Candidatus Hodarchaeota archaeon]